MSANFMLIHGSWHGGWAWQAVVSELTRRGYRAYAPTLPGHGPDLEHTSVMHRDCVDGVVAAIRRRDLHDIVLVGHSFGGTVVQKVAEEVAERVRRLVFVQALVLSDGQSVCDILPSELVSLFNQLAEASTDGTMLIPWETWRHNFIQDAPEPVARVLWQLLSPEPHRLNCEELRFKRFYALDIPRSWITLRQDRSLPSGCFASMAARLGTFDTLAMDGSHETMFTRPTELADMLVAAACGRTGTPETGASDR